ncbi:MAG TPA: hypothetical protein VMM76_19525 [Pirellulaceae bacterium]|nr:hypothetical protein [Pirellulaceae bacterium]
MLGDVLFAISCDAIVGVNRRLASDGLDSGIQFLLNQSDIFALNEAAMRGLVEQLAGGPEVFTDLIDLADQIGNKPQIGVLITGEVMDRDVACLPMPIESTVTLFEPRRIPRAIEVQQVASSALQVQSFRCSICRDKDTNLGIQVVKTLLDLFSLRVVLPAVQG